MRAEKGIFEGKNIIKLCRNEGGVPTKNAYVVRVRYSYQPHPSPSGRAALSLALTFQFNLTSRSPTRKGTHMPRSFFFSLASQIGSSLNRNNQFGSNPIHGFRSHTGVLAEKKDITKRDVEQCIEEGLKRTETEAGAYLMFNTDADELPAYITQVFHSHGKDCQYNGKTRRWEIRNWQPMVSLPTE